MQTFIRFVGVLNAAVWVGAAIFFTVAVGPAFFSAEMHSFLPPAYAGRAAEVMITRYFLLQNWCAGVALLHVLLEYVYSGRLAEKSTVALIGTFLGISLIGGFWLEPKLHELQVIKYSPHTSPAQKAEAAATFGALHGVSQGVNLLVIVGLLCYFWRITRPLAADRFPILEKFKS